MSTHPIYIGEEPSEIEDIPFLDNKRNKDGNSQHVKRNRESASCLYDIVVSLAIGAALATTLLAAFLLGRVSRHTSYKEPTCVLPQVYGNSGEGDLISLGKCPPDWREAKAKGCVYDFILSTWMHPRCFNGTMHDKYNELLQTTNITFWREPAMIHEVPFAEAVTGEHEGFLWTKGAVHHMHCAYIWDRIRNAHRTTPVVLDSICRDDEHIDHCILLGGVPFGWEVDAPNVTRVHNEPYEVDCLIG